MFHCPHEVVFHACVLFGNYSKNWSSWYFLLKSWHTAEGFISIVLVWLPARGGFHACVYYICSWLWLTFRQPTCVFFRLWRWSPHFYTGCRNVSHNNNSPSQNNTNLNDQPTRNIDSPGFRRFTKTCVLLVLFLKITMPSWKPICSLIFAERI